MNIPAVNMSEIEITYYKSPYLIFFKYLPSPDDKITNLEQAIEQHLKENTKEHIHSVFKIGEYVFVNYLPHQHGVRGIVLEIIYNFATMQPDYIIWCLDYGFPLRTRGDLVQLLPIDFREPIEGLHFEYAGLSNIIPMNGGNTLDWDYESCCKVFDVLSQEQQILLNKTEQILNKFGQNSMWCTLQFNRHGHTWDVSELLDSLKIGNSVDELQFKNIIVEHNFVQTAQLWTFCNGLNNYHVNEQSESDVTQTLHEFCNSFDESQNNSTCPESSNSKESVDNLMISQLETLKIGNVKCKIEFCFAQPSQLYNYNTQPKIKDNLHLLGINECNILQSYSWYHLHNDFGLFIVSPDGSGKKLCYLPHLLEMVNSEDLLSNTKNYGPAVIVVTANKSDTRTNEITELIGQLLDRFDIKTLNNLLHTQRDSDIPWSKPFGIYLTGLKDLFQVIKKKKIDKNRLKTIVINNINKPGAKELTNFILKYQQEIRGFQFVVTAKELCPNFGELLKIIPKAPLLLMSDFLEAAIFNGCDFIIKISENSEDMLNYLCHYIENQAALDEKQRMVIVCNTNNEAEQISEALRGSGISGSLYTREDDAAYITTQTMITNTVLICTDAMISKLKLSPMQTLIHYSLPTQSSWSSFTARFKLVCNFSSPSLNDPDNNDKPPKSVIILDKTDTEFLKEFLKFLQKHKLCEKTTLIKLSRLLTIESK